MVKRKGSLFTLILVFLAICFSVSSKVYAESAVSGERISGDDRYQTSINISRAGWPVSSTSGVAVIATGKDFPDALSAAPLAKKYDAPILLAGSNVLDQPLRNELTRLMIKKVYIVGGPGVVSVDIENKLVDMGIECIRLYGNDRYETSAAVANEIGEVSQVVLATGLNFPDALSIAPWAASSGVPILLTEPDKLPRSIDDYMGRCNIDNSYVIGGTGVVSEAVLSGLKNPKRLSGQDRFGTNVAVLNEFSSQFDFNKMYIATGNNFPDALSGSALAALTKSPIILTGTGLLPETKAYIDSNISRINEVYILGGEGVVSNSAVEGVIPPIVTNVEIILSAPSTAMNKEVRASANITMIPSNAPKPPVIFTVADSEIAKINAEGIITGLKVGNTRITASVGDKSSSTNLFVKLDKLIVIDPGHGGSSIGAVPTGPDGVTKLIDYREAVLNIQISQKLKRKLEEYGVRVVLTREGDTDVSLETRAKIANDLDADLFISIHHNSATNKLATGTSTYYSSYKPEAQKGTISVYAPGSGPVYDMNGQPLGNVTAGSKYDYLNTIADGSGGYWVVFNFNGSTAKVNAKADYITVKDFTLNTVVRQSGDIAVRIKDSLVSLGLEDRKANLNDFAVNRLTAMASVLVEVGFISNYQEFSRISQDSFQEQVAERIAKSVVQFYESIETPLQGVPATP